MHKHGIKPDQPMYQHLIDCIEFEECSHFLINYLSKSLLILFYVMTYTFKMLFLKTLNSWIAAIKWAQLQYFKVFNIKLILLGINNGLKTSKELPLFK